MINLSKKLWSVILILVFIFIFFSWNIDFLCTKSTIKNEEKCEKVNFSRDYSFSKNFSSITKIQNLTNFPAQIPDAGVGKGVPHQPLPHKAPPDRDGSPTLPHREADQNLVPEQVRLFLSLSLSFSLSLQEF